MPTARPHDMTGRAPLRVGVQAPIASLAGGAAPPCPGRCSDEGARPGRFSARSRCRPARRDRARGARAARHVPRPDRVGIVEPLRRHEGDGVLVDVEQPREGGRPAGRGSAPSRRWPGSRRACPAPCRSIPRQGRCRGDRRCHPIRPSRSARSASAPGPLARRWPRRPAAWRQHDGSHPGGASLPPDCFFWMNATGQGGCRQAIRRAVAHRRAPRALMAAAARRSRRRPPRACSPGLPAARRRRRGPS